MSCHSSLASRGDVIDRAEALRVVGQLGRGWAVGSNDAMYGFQVARNQALDAIRALPAATDERRCATCAHWHKEEAAIFGGVGYCSWIDRVHTEPFFFCAAWQARDGAK